MNKHGILLIFDEVQSGFGRTGKWFALDHFHVVPDIINAAKGIASGLPLSGVFTSTDLMLKLDVGSVGGTYGGNALACAAGVATIAQCVMRRCWVSVPVGTNLPRC